jgi:hypothetical protein
LKTLPGEVFTLCGSFDDDLSQGGHYLFVIINDNGEVHHEVVSLITQALCTTIANIQNRCNQVHDTLISDRWTDQHPTAP